MPVLFAESLFDDCRQIQVATLPHTLQPVFSRHVAMNGEMQLSIKMLERFPTASAPWLKSLKVLRSKPGTAPSAVDSTDGVAGSTIGSRFTVSSHTYKLIATCKCSQTRGAFKGCVIAIAVVRDIRPVTGKAAQKESHSEGNLFIAHLLPFPFFWKLP